MAVRHHLAVLLLVTIGVASTGCGSQVVPSSGSHPPTNPAEVKIYPTAPKKYELLGKVEVPVGGAVRWDSRGDATAGFEQLKAGAAARGANGILLTDPEGNNSLVLAGYRGAYYQVPVRHGTPNVAFGQAIYVHEE